MFYLGCHMVDLAAHDGCPREDAPFAIHPRRCGCHRYRFGGV